MRRVVLACAVIATLAGCERSPSPAPAPASGSGSKLPHPTPQMRLHCDASDPERPGTTTTYLCPAPIGAQCLRDVTACSPVARARGAVPPGGKCVHVSSPDAAKWELGDDCAPVPGKTSEATPKGSLCIMESGPGAYCTHACATTADCADLHRDGFAARCDAGLCLLHRGE